MTRVQLEILRREYVPGTRIRLDYMDGEPQMKQGLEGTVVFVDDVGQIHMRWDNGGSLAINPRFDSFEVIS